MVLTWTAERRADQPKIVSGATAEQGLAELLLTEGDDGCRGDSVEGIPREVETRADFGEGVGEDRPL